MSEMKTLGLLERLEAAGLVLRIADDGSLLIGGEPTEEQSALILERVADLRAVVSHRQAMKTFRAINARLDSLESRLGPTKEEARKERSIAAGLRFDVLTRDKFRCTYCGAKGDGVELHADHFVPVSRGGKSTMENLRTACSDCNAGKAAKMLDLEPKPEPRRVVLRHVEPPQPPLSHEEVKATADAILAMLGTKKHG